jgi:CubicO group peptidase (beta-lactamase class C family)
LPGINGIVKQYAGVRQIAEKIEEAISNNRIPGAVVGVTNRHKTTWQQAFGYADIDSLRAQQVDDIFYIASSSKPLAATTIYVQAEARGELTTRTKLMLAHSAGIFGNDTKDPIERDLLRSARRTLAEAAAGIAARPLVYPPGEGSSYSDAGLMLAGHEAAAAAGTEFDVLMRDVLLTPLEMHDTFYRIPEGEAAEAISSRLAVSYQRTGGTLHHAALQHRLKHDGLLRVGSGLFSTAADLAAFLRLHISERERFAEMHRDHTIGRWKKDPMGGENVGYGLGWQLGGGAFFHAGAFGSLIWAHPQKGIGVVLLTQMPIMQVYAFWREIVREIHFD